MDVLEAPMFLQPQQAIKFSLLTALGAIFIDAVIAHGLFWDNDPYWTYWITKTFLIASVFLFGTAFLGIGIRQGLILTAVHTLILEVYYQWLAPVGLPQEPEWLDFSHLWVSGIPAHYLAILTGYFLALWLWRLNHRPPHMQKEAAAPPARAFVLYGLLAAVAVVVLDGIITQMLLLHDFPGITFFVQHLLTAFVFICAWAAYAGLGRASWLTGSLMLALLWVAYNMYLGPRGLPLHPPAYSDYQDLWVKSFPGALLSALLGWPLAGKLMKIGRNAAPFAALVIVCLLSLAGASPAAAQTADQSADGLKATAAASGDGVRISGPDPVNMESSQPMTGDITIETIETGNRWSHVQNTDLMHVTANFTAGGAAYHVTIDKPMPRHPLGKYTTWSGVVYNHEMHGDTGIGTGKLPRMRPEIALWGWAEVTRDGKVISRMAPAHVMVTTKGPMPGVMLEIDTEDKALIAEPDGYITVMWHKIDSLSLPTEQLRLRQIIGWAALIGMTLLFGWLARRADADRYSSPAHSR
jgi:hypothetical protein